MPLWIYPNAFSGPDEAQEIDDLDEEWADGLADPEILSPDQKTMSDAVCGAEFRDGATRKTQDEENLLWCHALVLDVDVWREDRPPFELEDFQTRFPGVRFIVWTTFSSSLQQRRWRLVLPLSSPMPPRRYKALFRLVNDTLDNTVADGCCDPGRLGFLASVGSQSAKDSYQWHIQQGDRLDWTAFDLEEEETSFLRAALNPADMKLSPDALSDAQALESAKRYFRRVGVEVEEGSRHETLLRAGCKLWWDFALKEEAVRAVLHAVNQSFPVPKSDASVEDEIKAAFERVLGANRVEQPDVYGSMREPVARATKTAVAEHAKKLRRAAKEDKRILGRVLQAMCKEDAMCEQLEARSLLPKAAGELADLYPREPPERLLDLMRGSLTVQRLQPDSSHVPTDEEILSKIRWTQNAHRKREEERAKLRGDLRKAQISMAFGGTRDTPYTPQEFREFEAAGLERNQWVLQQGRSYYAFVGGTYKGPFSKDEASVFVPQMLSPAHEELTLSYVNKDGKVCAKTIDALMSDYGSFVLKLEKSLTGTKASFDPLDNRLLLPACPAREDLHPKYSPEADEWLKLLALDKYDSLCTWLAAVTYLDRPLVALVLSTPKNWGKNLFVESLAKLWRDRPVLLKEYRAGALERCPLVWTDERLPKHLEGNFGSYLKQVISEPSREVKHAYHDPYVLLGHTRHLFTVNGIEKLNLFREDMNEESRAALRERLLIIENIKKGSGAATYLKKLGLSGRQALVDGAFAQHVLWLKDNRPPNFDIRLLVEDSDPAGTETIALIGQDRVSRVFDWLHSFVSDGKASTEAVLCKNDQLYLNAPLMQKTWLDFDSTRKGIGQRELQLAVSTASHERRADICIGDGASARTVVYRRLRMEEFHKWLEQSDIDVEEFKGAMAKLEQRRKCTVK